jgi:hypothetical protein
MWWIPMKPDNHTGSPLTPHKNMTAKDKTCKIMCQISTVFFPTAFLLNKQTRSQPITIVTHVSYGQGSTSCYWGMTLLQLFRWSTWSLFLQFSKCLWPHIQMFSVRLPLLAIVSGLSTQDICSRGRAQASLYKSYQDLRTFIKQSWRMHSVVICGKRL